MMNALPSQSAINSPLTESISILVHNVAHSDLLLCVQLPHSKEELMCRPRASRFNTICRRIIQAINKGSKFKGVTYKNKYNSDCFIGIEFIDAPKACKFGEIRLRDTLSSTMANRKSNQPMLVSKVFFPLISVLLPKWIALHKKNQNFGSKTDNNDKDENKHNNINTNPQTTNNKNEETNDLIHSCFIRDTLSNQNASPAKHIHKRIYKSTSTTAKTTHIQSGMTPVITPPPHELDERTEEIGQTMDFATITMNIFYHCFCLPYSESTSLISMSGDSHFSDSFVSDGGVGTDGIVMIGAQKETTNRTVAGRGSIDLAMSASGVGNSDTDGGAVVNNSDNDSHDEKDLEEVLSRTNKLKFLKQHSKRPSIKHATIKDCNLKLFLLSGAGGQNHSDGDKEKQTHKDVYENTRESTQLLALLVEAFVSEFFDNIDVKHFYSKNDSHQYSGNAKFLNEILRPAIDDERSKIAEKFGKQWKKHFKLIIALCDGEPGRVTSIMSGLTTFEPSLLHIWRTKAFWKGYPNVLINNSVGSDNDIEYLLFNELQTYPSMPVCKLTDTLLVQLVNEMKEWKMEFDSANKNPDNEITQFWLRKSYQLVLVVVAVQKNGYPKAKFYRGCNMEVSMPTGSLCAERNAIGSALSQDLTIRREEFKMVAVYGMKDLNKSKIRDINPIGPCGSCREWLGKIAAVNPSLKIVTFSDFTMSNVFVRSLK